MSTAKCRSHGEQFPRISRDRLRSKLVKQFETPWTICDLEDVITGRPGRATDLEACKLRNSRGIYGQRGDDLHFRTDIAVAAGDELLKAARRTALRKYPGMEADGSVLLVLAAGWNADHTTFDCLDSDGHAWRKAELVALAELCALDGHPASTFRVKFKQLLRRLQGEHTAFLLQPISDICAIAPSNTSELQRALEHTLSAPAEARKASCLLWPQQKRQRCQTDAEKLSELTGIPEETAQSILEATGTIAGALQHPMFQPTPQLAARSFKQRLRQPVEVINLDDDLDDP
ncbi:PAT23, partial [Symbiodinium pilosum]